MDEDRSERPVDPDDQPLDQQPWKVALDARTRRAGLRTLQVVLSVFAVVLAFGIVERMGQGEPWYAMWDSALTIVVVLLAAFTPSVLGYLLIDLEPPLGTAVSLVGWLAALAGIGSLFHGEYWQAAAALLVAATALGVALGSIWAVRLACVEVVVYVAVEGWGLHAFSDWQGPGGVFTGIVLVLVQLGIIVLISSLVLGPLRAELRKLVRARSAPGPDGDRASP